MFQWFQSDFWQRQLRQLVPLVAEVGYRILLTLALYWLLRWVFRKAVSAVVASMIGRSATGAGQAARLRTLQALLQSIINYILLFVAAVMILDALRLNISALLASAGVAGMALGFGAQRLVRDVITGFFILTEDQYAVGDRITVGAVTGTVEDIGMRITRLRDDSGAVVTLANGDIASVTNHSRGPAVSVVEVSVPRDSGLDRLIAAVQGLTPSADGALLKSPAFESITAVEPDSFAIRFRALAREGKQQEAETLLKRKIHAVLSAAEPEQSAER